MNTRLKISERIYKISTAQVLAGNKEIGMTFSPLHRKSLQLPSLLCLALLAGCSSMSQQKKPAGSMQEMLKEQAEEQKKSEQNSASILPGNFKTFRGTGQFVKPTPPTVVKDASPVGDDISLNFENADIREVVKTILNDILHENYMLDPRVQGFVNLRTSKPIPRAALLPTLETMLRTNGATMVKDGEVYQVTLSSLAVRGNVTPMLGGGTTPLPMGYSVQLVPLKFMAAKEMVKILEPLAVDPSAVRADEQRNMLVIAGTQKELRHLLDTVDLFDVDFMSGMSLGMYTFQSADVKTVMQEVESVFGDKNQSPLAGVVRFVPLERVNGVMIITPQPKYLEQARVWLERLDRAGAGSGGGTRLFVYPVQNASAEKLADLLSQLFGGSKNSSKPSTSGAVAPGQAAVEIKTPGAQVTANTNAATPAAAVTIGSTDSLGLPKNLQVVADKDNNTLLILANPSDYEKIEAALRKLDIAPRQVLVEIMIAKVNLDGAFSYGLDWYFKGKDGLFGGVNFGKVGSTGGGLPATVPSINSPMAGFSLIKPDFAGGVRAILNMLASDGRVNVVASPQILVTDNQSASIQVGSSVPVQSSTQSSTGTSGNLISYQYIETGTLLTVKPRINAGGLVTMEISQELSSPGKTADGGTSNPPIDKQTAKSTVAVRNGETMVLAGLISDRKEDSSTGLPVVSSIPLLGGLFGKESISHTRQELVLMITPHVIESDNDGRELAAEMKKKFPELKEQWKIMEQSIAKTDAKKAEKTESAKKHQGDKEPTAGSLAP